MARDRNAIDLIPGKDGVWRPAEPFKLDPRVSRNTFSGFDYGAPGGDHTAFTYVDENGEIVIEVYDETGKLDPQWFYSRQDMHRMMAEMMRHAAMRSKE